MLGNDDSAAPGRFVASGMPVPRMSNKTTLILWFAMVATIGLIMVAVSQGLFPGFGPIAFMILALGAPFAFMAFQTRGWSSANKPVVICLNPIGLTVDRWPGDVFSFGNVRLGLWTTAVFGGTTTGTALHLRSGQHSLVIGGRDHRLSAGTRLDEPPVQYPDAWMPAADFDSLLAAVAHRSGLVVRRPGPGEPTRCVLIPCPDWFFSDTLSGTLASLTRPFKLGFSRRAQSAEPSLAIDLDDSTVRVVEPHTNTVIASAPLAQVSAIPARHTYYRKSGLTMPVMVVRIPGLQERLRADRPLTISCREGRLSWNIHAPSEPPPAFVVSGADWLVLAEKFGLAPHLAVRNDQAGASYGRRLGS